ncbi:endoplasmic reticulum-Golgi intermediate compartment protein 2-like [Callorhinchus milii]|uniref:Endoplasmic reticulum-Golgi intermediate compartment protein n=1 Tax=Callorhinchus milii TaxID=7868 RepID=A0A4W3GD65_CALMI|nr:endoplasmic reticulum-Golgi intermediate compartment protein 2-like [Callorhinchus milii]|eukprot:gi/632941692/ref/XP_007886000.1/ PREDICTED: endoplasmic reticulum-Golgi intermediate compartment protein 2-like [Callorhinchus milii]
MRRRFGRRASLGVIKGLDIFPKVPEVCVETTATGGTVSLLVFVLIAILTIGESLYYCNSWIKYNYVVDTSIQSKLQINIDLTVAMKCDYIGADILDLSDTVVEDSEDLHYEPTQFELTPEEKDWYGTRQDIHEKLQEEHNLLDYLIKSSFEENRKTKAPRKSIDVNSTEPPNACRVYGSIYVNKVAGNFHVLSGKSYELPIGHAHVIAVRNPKVYNFSHRIDDFSFGVSSPGLINPLDGSVKITESNLHMFQYFLVLVPTEVNTYSFSTSTHQYSVTEKEQTLTEMKKGHGIPGIFLKYDISPLKVIISEEGMSTRQLLIRLCGIIGGIFSTAGLLHNISGFIVNLIGCICKRENHCKRMTSSAPTR